jgi:exodeoxyribonuclease VIII
MTENTFEVGIYPNMDINLYHRMPGLSSTGAKKILDCPFRYHWKYNLMQPEDSSESQLLGKAFHCLLLEESNFDKYFHVSAEKVDRRTTEGKKNYAAELEKAEGKDLVSKQMFEKISDMVLELSGYPIYNTIIKGNKEYSIFFKGGLYKTELRARPDTYNDDIILDIKTTSNLQSFEAEIFRYKYYLQAAMQYDGLYYHEGKKREFGFVAIETKAPYLIKCFKLNEESLLLGREEYFKAAEIYKQCIIEDEWPRYESGFQLVKKPNWVNSTAMDIML